LSCQRKESYMHYEPTDIASWGTYEGLSFKIDSLKESGSYRMKVHVRTSTVDRYPFKVLFLEVRQKWSRNKTELIDTIPCNLAADEHKAGGVSLLQYDYPVCDIRCYRGDSAQIIVRHIMRKEEVQGISDIGISLIHESQRFAPQGIFDFFKQ